MNSTANTYWMNARPVYDPRGLDWVLVVAMVMDIDEGNIGEVVKGIEGRDTEWRTILLCSVTGGAIALALVIVFFLQQRLKWVLAAIVTAAYVVGVFVCIAALPGWYGAADQDMAALHSQCEANVESAAQALGTQSATDLVNAVQRFMEVFVRVCPPPSTRGLCVDASPPPPPRVRRRPCPRNTSVRTVIFGDPIDWGPGWGTELIGEGRVQRTLLFGPYFLGTLLFAGHGAGGGGVYA